MFCYGSSFFIERGRCCVHKVLVHCPLEACIPIEKWEVKSLFHGWPNEAVFEGGMSGI